MKPEGLKALKNLNLTNNELWLCLINSSNILVEDLRQIEKNYNSMFSASAAELLGEKPSRPNVVTENSKFNYPEGRMGPLHTKDVYSLFNPPSGEPFIHIFGAGAKEFFGTLPIGKEYAEDIEDYFSREILPHLSEDNMVLASRTKFDEPGICDKKMLRVRDKMRPYVEDAERNAKKMYDIMIGKPIKVYETIPPTSIKNRIKRAIYWMMENP